MKKLILILTLAAFASPLLQTPAQAAQTHHSAKGKHHHHHKHHKKHKK
jgi:hypothetical protein